MRRRRTAQLLLTAGLLGALVFPGAAPAGAHADPPAAAATVPLRVVSYNIHAGAGTDNVFDLDRQAEALRSLDADVIGLQEVDVHWGARSGWRDLATELGGRLGMEVYFAPIYSLDPLSADAPRREYGVAVLSRYPILSAENHDITRLSTQEANPVPAPAPGFPEVRIRVRGVPVHVYTTHLDYRADPSVRAAQVADTLRILDEDCDGRGRCPRQILTGDFNAVHAAPELAPLWERLTDASTEAGADAPTYPALNPRTRIDHVAVSPGTVVVKGVTVPETLASDHRPVVADLALRRGR
ncbi:endonuclease/exonuclease/phosphatase family protein [Streptomyces fragilis]|uniref:Endonuclease/exonuclease/phosphatase family protein n=1 Tax=Streptomyces fragilis TaxID=67301 RepID=A0ABV2YNE3_9ACTN|nr:endonuclease/exonuclease/phosphatase family protein [Streptomyces fragilis]